MAKYERYTQERQKKLLIKLGMYSEDSDKAIDEIYTLVKDNDELFNTYTLIEYVESAAFILKASKQGDYDFQCALAMGKLASEAINETKNVHKKMKLFHLATIESTKIDCMTTDMLTSKVKASTERPEPNYYEFVRSKTHMAAKEIWRAIEQRNGSDFYINDDELHYSTKGDDLKTITFKTFSNSLKKIKD